MVEGQGGFVNEVKEKTDHGVSLFGKIGVKVDVKINLNMDIKIPFVGHLKILIGFMQILTSMNLVFDVPWPGFFTRFLSGLTFINIDVPNLFQGCEFAVSFEGKYYLHMTLLPILIVIMFLAYKIVLLCCMKKTTRKNAFGAYIKSLSVIIFLLYPGMTVKIFQIFDCRRFDTKGYLRADYEYECCSTWNISTNKCENEPSDYQILRITAVIFMIFYAFGIPLAALLVLWWNKASLHNEKHPDHAQTLHRYGGLYETYDAECWYWETIELLRKMILTGFMIILVPGSSAQILIGLLICLFYLLLLIKYAPFADQNEDRLGMVASLQLLLMLIGAFALKTDDKESGTYDGVVIATSLMVMNIGVFVLGVWTIIYAFPDAKSVIEHNFYNISVNSYR
jgi:hypothetical protein